MSPVAASRTLLSLFIFNAAVLDLAALAAQQSGSHIQSAAAEAVPLFEIKANTPYDAGRQHGALAVAQIHGWLKAAEMQTLLQFVATGEST